MRRTCVCLTEEDFGILKTIEEKQGCRTYSQAISWALKNSQENKAALAKAVRQELEEHYLPKERIKWATQTAEQNSIVLLDAMNTLLWTLEVGGCISTEHMPHTAIEQSRDNLKKKIAHFKEKSDERKSKMGINPTGGHL